MSAFVHHCGTRIETRFHAGTKEARLATAEAAVRHGFRSKSELEGSALCSICGTDVPTVRRTVEYKLEDWGPALVGAMVHHIETAHTETRHA
jgi:hypothetical protein